MFSDDAIVIFDDLFDCDFDMLLFLFWCFPLVQRDRSQVLNASTLAWISSVGPERLQSHLFPMHVWLSFMQKNQVNVGGQVLSLLDMEHNILRAQSKAPKFGWIFQQKGRLEQLVNSGVSPDFKGLCHKCPLFLIACCML